MMPITPRGTRIWPTWMPLGRDFMFEISPIGSGIAASCSQPSAQVSMIFGVSLRRSTIGADRPAAVARSMSRALAGARSAGWAFGGTLAVASDIAFSIGIPMAFCAAGGAAVFISHILSEVLEISDRGISMIEAFATADQVLLAGVQGITDLITTPGLINLDFADVKSVMQGAGSALMGIGSARGADRAIKAAELAVESPLLEASIEGAHGVLLSIQGGSNLGIFEINDAAQLVKEAAHPEANIIFGTVIDDTLGDEVRVTVIAAGFDGGEPQARIEPITAQRPVSAPLVPAVSADEAAREIAEADHSAPKETVSVTASSDSYDSVFGDDDLDIPDFLK